MKRIIVLGIVFCLGFSALVSGDDKEYVEKAVGIFSSYAELQKEATELLVRYVESLDKQTVFKEDFSREAEDLRSQSEELYKASDLDMPESPELLEFDRLFQEFAAVADNYFLLLMQLTDSEGEEEIADKLNSVTEILNSLKDKALKLKAEIDRLNG